MAKPQSPHGLHALEAEFGLSATEILDLIGERPRLGMAVRGGVAERHLEKVLRGDSAVTGVEITTGEGPPDFIVRLPTGRTLTVECKNASPVTYADGTPNVETQKTRASKGDPKSRLYDPSQFDVVAAASMAPCGGGSSGTSARTSSHAMARTRIESPRFNASMTLGRRR